MLCLLQWGFHKTSLGGFIKSWKNAIPNIFIYIFTLHTYTEVNCLCVFWTRKCRLWKIVTVYNTILEQVQLKALRSIKTQRNYYTLHLIYFCGRGPRDSSMERSLDLTNNNRMIKYKIKEFGITFNKFRKHREEKGKFDNLI